jgi:tetratricopeptide (TPR) repeat protein
VDVSKLIEKAREAAERRNYDYAIDLYLQACKLSPDTAIARRELRAVENRMAKEKGASFWTKGKTLAMHSQVQMLYSTKKYDSAIEKAEETLKADPGNVSVLLLLGKAAAAANYWESAIATFEDIKSMNAGGNTKQLIEALRELAYAYESKSKIKEAMDTWQLINRHAPGDRDATVKLRDLSAKTMSNQIQQAAETGQRGAAARSTQTDDQKKAAAKMEREKSFDIKTEADLKAVIDDAKEEIAARPDDPRLYVKLGDYYKTGNNYAEAKKAYEQAREKDPNNFSWLFRLHDLEIWKMHNLLKQLVAKANTGDAAAREQAMKDKLALLDYRLTSFVEREKQYSTDSKIKHELGTVYYELAGTKGDKTLYDEAIKRFQTTFQDPKFRKDAGLRMGLGFCAKGQFDLALKRFDETLKGMELKDEIWKNLTYAKADTLQKAGRKDEAKEVFLQIYEIDVSFKDIAKRVDELSQTA